MRGILLFLSLVKWMKEVRDALCPQDEAVNRFCVQYSVCWTVMWICFRRIAFRRDASATEERVLICLEVVVCLVDEERDEIFLRVCMAFLGGVKKSFDSCVSLRKISRDFCVFFVDAVNSRLH